MWLCKVIPDVSYHLQTSASFLAKNWLGHPENYSFSLSLKCFLDQCVENMLYFILNKEALLQTPIVIQGYNQAALAPFRDS